MLCIKAPKPVGLADGGAQPELRYRVPVAGDRP